MTVCELYERVTHAAEHPRGGIPEGWSLLRVQVYGDFEPDEGEWWHAAAEYGQCGRRCGVRRLIGAGNSVRAALTALEMRLAEPLPARRANAMGGWDAHNQAGHVIETV